MEAVTINCFDAIFDRRTGIMIPKRDIAVANSKNIISEFKAVSDSWFERIYWAMGVIGMRISAKSDKENFSKFFSRVKAILLEINFHTI
jgi:hypothetical protein